MGENSEIQTSATWRWLPQCEAWGLVLHHLLPGAGITRGSWKPCRFQKERQVDTNWLQGIRLNKGYCKRTVHSRPHTCSSIPILFPSERRQRAPSIAEPKPESSCFFLCPHTFIESPNSDTVHSSKQPLLFFPPPGPWSQLAELLSSNLSLTWLLEWPNQTIRSLYTDFLTGKPLPPMVPGLS